MKNTGFIRYILLFLLLFSAISCNSGGETLPLQVQEDLDEVFFQQLLDDQSYDQGLRFLFGEETELSEQDVEIFQEKFTQGLSRELAEYNNDSKWDQALSEYTSLQTLGVSLPGDLKQNDLFYYMILHHLSKEKPAAAAALVLDQLKLDLLSDSQLKELEQSFITQPNQSAQKKIVDELSLRNLEIGEESLLESSRNVKKSDLVDGTVTIWVDRGIRMEKGVGLPDRVIGSGFFIDDQGYLITNYHVISSEVDPGYEGYSKLYIKRDDREGEKIPARVIGWDPVMDLALIKTEMQVPYHFSFAPEVPLELGDSIFAIGSPGGLEKTLTSGTISAQSRYLQQLGKSMQVDVPINPGNSGGPLLNQDGQIIGVVFSGIEEFEGINFAIPSRYVKSLLPRLYQGGQAEYGWLGASLFKNFDKITVSYTLPGFVARTRGLQKGDEILKVNSLEVESITDIQDILFPLSPGTLVKLNIKREGVPLELILPLDSRPDYPMGVALEKDALENLILPIFGMDLERTDSSKFRKHYRVTQVFPGTIADETGIMINDKMKLMRWEFSQEEHYVILQILLEGRSAGYLESVIQIGSWFAVNSFI